MKHILRVFSVLIIFSAFFVITRSTYSQPKEVFAANKVNFLVRITENTPSILRQPNGPFAVYHFTQYAQGEYIGIVYHDVMPFGPKPFDAPWKYTKRFWQDEEWGSDVTSIAWSPSGKYLYIATSNIYGSGKLFEIDLFNKNAQVVYPIDEDRCALAELETLIYIQEIDTQNLVLKVLVKTSDSKFVKEINMR